MDESVRRLQKLERECVETIAIGYRKELLRGDFSGWIREVPGDIGQGGYKFQKLEAACALHPLAQSHLAAWTVASAPVTPRRLALQWRGGDLQSGGDLQPVAAFVLAYQVRELGLQWGAPDDSASVFGRRATRRRPAPHDQQPWA